MLEAAISGSLGGYPLQGRLNGWKNVLSRGGSPEVFN
jgi:hypothetical protein